jgi:dolichyl-phosphate-mannose-protein mannosyltransferase
LHPPLGKQILAIFGYFLKFDSNLYSHYFPFPGGAKYIEGLKYVELRIVCAFFGALVVPLTYLSGIELKISKKISILLGVLIAIENSLVVMSKFILLDAFLLFFNSLTCYCFLKFNNNKRKEFSFSWWTWQFLLGISMGGLISIKWTGFQTYGLIGIFTIYDLFIYYIKNFKNTKIYAIHWLSRIVCLIILPFFIYTSLFYIHFEWFTISGDGSPKMNTAFKSKLKGNTLYGPLEITYNSTVTLKNSRIGGGNLYTSPQIQYYNNWVSTYLNNDPGLNWIIKKNYSSNENKKADEYVYDGDIIQIVHKDSNTFLTAALYDNAPYTKSMKRVISKTDIQENSLWKIEFIKNPSIKQYIEIKNGVYNEIPNVLHPITTKFHLRNVKLNCLLRSHNVVLPMSKGWKRLEAGCDFNHENSSETLWHIENNTPQINKGLKYMYHWNLPQSFWKNFFDYHSAMINVNKMMEPFPRTPLDKRLDSHPKKWPFLNVGVRLLNWDDKTVKFYLLGNPFIWWLATFAIICVSGISLLKLKNKKSVFAEYFTIGGWAINYIPYFIVGRMTYLHHYLVSLYFSIVCLAILLDFYILPAIRTPIIGRLFIILFALISISISVFFSPFVYGFTGPAINMKNRQWLKTWNIY